MIYVCPEKDIECGIRPENWCTACTLRGADTKTATAADGLPEPLQRLIDSIDVVDGSACWDYMAMYAVRDGLQAAQAEIARPRELVRGLPGGEHALDQHDKYIATNDELVRQPYRPPLAQLQRLLNRRWIACTELLPPADEGMKVLAYTRHHDYGGAQFHHMKAMDFYELDPDGDGEPGTDLARNVTHWMPEPWPPGDEA